ncbi:hypothetical protein J6590_030409 [Homalodisca vitripennis]|nr:hypothetical protein J6590_030409 [Homalodisca vitripennis]
MNITTAWVGCQAYPYLCQQYCQLEPLSEATLRSCIMKAYVVISESKLSSSCSCSTLRERLIIAANLARMNQLT